MELQRGKRRLCQAVCNAVLSDSSITEMFSRLGSVEFSVTISSLWDWRCRWWRSCWRWSTTRCFSCSLPRLFFTWNFATCSLSRWIFLGDFFLCFFSFGNGFRCLGVDWEWTSLGFPRKTERFMKALPFTVSMNRRALLLDLQHFTNWEKEDLLHKVRLSYLHCLIELIWIKNSPLWNNTRHSRHVALALLL